MTPEQTLSALGFPVARIGLIRATTLFQQGYNVDGGLTIDGQYGPLTRHAAEYSLAHGKACSAHFTWDEFACQCHGKYGCDVIWVQRRLLIALERLRTACYPQGLTVVSGCRCEKRNAEVGGAPSSQHVLGVAADVPPVALKETVMNLRVFGGVGYSPSRDRFRVCHVDLRPGTPVSFPDGP
jgi:hypothetical protein